MEASHIVDFPTFLGYQDKVNDSVWLKAVPIATKADRRRYYREAVRWTRRRPMRFTVGAYVSREPCAFTVSGWVVTNPRSGGTCDVTFTYEYEPAYPPDFDIDEDALEALSRLSDKAPETVCDEDDDL